MSVACVNVVEVLSELEFCTTTFNVEVSARLLGTRNLWSASVESTVYLVVTKVPS